VQGFTAVTAVRQITNGTVFIVGRRATDGAGYWIYRVSTDNTVTLITGVPGLVVTPEGYGNADVSTNGTRLAYLNSLELRVVELSTGEVTALEPDARSPRWSPQGDRIAYLVPPSRPQSAYDGVPTVINADGSGRRTLSNELFSPGVAWSPDGAYIIGRTSLSGGFRVIRVADGASLLLQYLEHYQPDWR